LHENKERGGSSRRLPLVEASEIARPHPQKGIEKNAQFAEIKQGWELNWSRKDWRSSSYVLSPEKS